MQGTGISMMRACSSLLLLLSLDVAAAYSSALNLVQPRGISTRPLLGRSAGVRCQETQLMNVVVPDGMAGGQMLQVDTPAGLMQVQIPDGLGAGATFQMSVPVAAPTVPVAAPTPAAMMPPPPAVVLLLPRRGRARPLLLEPRLTVLPSAPTIRLSFLSFLFYSILFYIFV